MDEEVHLREGALSKVPFNENSKNLNKDLNKDVKKNWKQRNNRKKFYNNKKNDAIESTVMKSSENKKNQRRDYRDFSDKKPANRNGQNDQNGNYSNRVTFDRNKRSKDTYKVDKANVPEVTMTKTHNITDANGKPTLKIIPLGGLEQIGMNITAFEYGDSIIVVDCGLAFPEEDMLGIDLVIPDVTYLKNNIHKLKGFVFTHGHEDHIGAVPYVLKQVNAPLYATRLTIGLIESKLSEHNMLRDVTRNVVQYGDVVELGDFKVEFIRTNHSITDACALAITSPVGTVIHTGDFKVDYTPVYGDPIDLQRLGELGRQGVLALMCDSTNALRPGFTMSEKTVGETLDKIFNDNKNRRLIVATFASNVDRVQQIINIAAKYGRKVCVEGRSMTNIIRVASEMGYLDVPKGILIETDEMKRYEDEQIVLITTGSQGESMAALSRMASNIHKKVQIQAGDCIVFSSSPIPGNEKSVARVINDLSRKGAKVIFQDTHVSGHACQEEIKLMYSLVKPKFSFPVHGEFRHLIGQKEVAQSLGYDDDHVIIVTSGTVVSLSEDKYEIAGHVETGTILVDGLGVGDVGNIVLRDRQNLATNGIVIVVITLDKYSCNVIAGPDIVTRGFVYVREAENLLNEAREVVSDSVEHCASSKITDWSKIKTVVKDDLSDYFWKKMKRTPVILPIIMEAHM